MPLRLQLKNETGRPRYVNADLLDRSESGIGISLAELLPLGERITVWGQLRQGEPEMQLQAEVIWCSPQPNGVYRAGLELDHGDEFAGQWTKATAPEEFGLDCYEVLQLSPNADTETIHRVYRLLAQRYHPDNPDTGNNEMFVRLVEAYSILSNSERRAQFDAHHREIKRLQWKIFDQSQTTVGVEAEKRKRRGILGLLHAKMLADPEQCLMSIFDFEELLGCPREHLEAALWYLRGKGFIERGDGGGFVITIAGFDEHESSTLASGSGRVKMIESAE